MSEMVERVATAICCNATPDAGHPFNFTCMGPRCDCWETHALPSARAAIEAMREPAKAMLEVGAQYLETLDTRQAMLDAALTPPTEDSK